MVLVIVLHSGVPPPADEVCDTVDAPTPQGQCIDNYVPEILQIY